MPTKIPNPADATADTNTIAPNGIFAGHYHSGYLANTDGELYTWGRGGRGGLCGGEADDLDRPTFTQLGGAPPRRAPPQRSDRAFTGRPGHTNKGRVRGGLGSGGRAAWGGRRGAAACVCGGGGGTDSAQRPAAPAPQGCSRWRWGARTRCCCSTTT